MSGPALSVALAWAPTPAPVAGPGLNRQLWGCCLLEVMSHELLPWHIIHRTKSPSKPAVLIIDLERYISNPIKYDVTEVTL